MSDPRRGTLVIGLGSPLMADDGAGLVALEQLRDGWSLPDGVELVDGGTWGMNLLPMIEGAERVIFLDAIHGGESPGTVIEIEGAALPHVLHHKLSPHQIDLGEVLALATLRGTLPADLRAIGIEPEVVEMRTTLSPSVTRALPALLARVVARLEAAGFRCVPRPGVAACTS
jgi:hydrogenase maturation protease